MITKTINLVNRVKRNLHHISFKQNKAAASASTQRTHYSGSTVRHSRRRHSSFWSCSVRRNCHQTDWKALGQTLSLPGLLQYSARGRSHGVLSVVAILMSNQTVFAYHKEACLIGYGMWWRSPTHPSPLMIQLLHLPLVEITALLFLSLLANFVWDKT